MKTNRAFLFQSRVATWVLTLSFCFSIMLTGHSAGRVGASTGSNETGSRDKVSCDLRETVNSPSAGNSRVQVVLQFRGRPSGLVDTAPGRCGARLKSDYRNLDARAVEMPASAVNDLVALDEVTFVSPDREVQSCGHLSATTGTDLVRGQSSGPGSELDGTGIGIAVLDSGMYVGHTSFLDRSGRRRVVVNQSFTDGGSTGDEYGHGTNVAAIAAGNGRVANASYLGIAPNANIINLRVLNSRGVGTASNVLRALDCVLANRASQNIRVVNLSFGMPAVDSYTDDPVCRAVRRLADAGVVVVVAAGNNGKDEYGSKLYGAIQSPGNEPSAITVGSLHRRSRGFAWCDSRGSGRHALSRRGRRSAGYSAKAFALSAGRRNPAAGRAAPD